MAILETRGAKSDAPAPCTYRRHLKCRKRTRRLPNAGAEALSAKLHRFSVPLEAFGDATAHPRELSDRSEFVDAVALLADMNVPLETVTQYALGANWTMSCAALAALAQRADGQQASKDVLAFFGRLRPWAMHYALEYLSSLKQPAVAGRAGGVGGFVVAGQSDYSGPVPRLFHARREVGRQAEVRAGGDGVLCVRSGGHRRVLEEPRSSVCDGVDRGLEDGARGETRSRVPGGVRAVLVDVGRFVDRAGGVEGSARRGGERVGAVACAVVDRARRCEGRQERVLAFARRPLDREGLDDLRSRRARGAGGAVLYRAA